MLLPSTSARAWSAMSEASTAYTFDAPACTAKNASKPVPVPTSRTTLPARLVGFEVSAVWYVPVRMPVSYTHLTLPTTPYV